METGLWALDTEIIAETLSDADPALRAWAAETQRRGDLEPVILAVVRAGYATDVPGALRYIAEFAGARSRSRVRIAKGDFEGKTLRHRFNRLRRLLGKSDPVPAYDVFRWHGLVSHAAVPMLLSGELAEIFRRSRVLQSQRTQLNFAVSRVREEDGRVTIAPPQLEGPLRRPVLKRAVARWEYLRKLLIQWNGGGYNLQLRRPAMVRRFYASMRAVFGDLVDRLWRPNELFEQEDLILLTLLSWGGATAEYLRLGARPLFREVPVFPHRFDASGGRIDALEVRAINGKAPDLSQKRALYELARERFSSVGELINILCWRFQAPVQVVIEEWKFSVGDGIGGVLKPEYVTPGAAAEDQEQVGKHKRQVEQYLVLAMLSYNLQKGYKPEVLWHSDQVGLAGEVVYFFPQTEPVHIEVPYQPSRGAEIFASAIGYAWRGAAERAELRKLTNDIVTHVTQAVTSLAKPPRRKNHHTSEPFLPMELPEGEIARLVKANHRPRKFRGSFGIIEVIERRRRDELLLLHVDKLLAAINSGEVRAGQFDIVRGGFIACLLHEERTPSMSVNFARGFFKCFGCGAHGVFAKESIPPGVEITVEPPSVVNRENKKSQSLVIPERLRDIMRVAQESLARAFLRERAGAAYIEKVRGLDPVIAASYGTGFGTERLIHDLLDAGFSYQELVDYGFLGVSARVPAQAKIPRLLQSRGFRASDLARIVKVAEKGGAREKSAYPYSVLDGRVTFPLELSGVVTSFYGRAIAPDTPSRFKHRKLSNRFTRLPHGAFNSKALRSGARLVVVTEAAICALTFIQVADHLATEAMIGVDNVVVIEELARFDGGIAVALDYDKNQYQTGQTSTQKLMRNLVAHGFRGPFYDWSARLVAEHPGVNYKDPNQLWVDTHMQIEVWPV